MKVVRRKSEKKKKIYADVRLCTIFLNPKSIYEMLYPEPK
jgi:hypothetical protein